MSDLDQKYSDYVAAIGTAEADQRALALYQEAEKRGKVIRRKFAEIDNRDPDVFEGALNEVLADLTNPKKLPYDPSRGSFTNFFLKSLNNRMVDESRRDNRHNERYKPLGAFSSNLEQETGEENGQELFGEDRDLVASNVFRDEFNHALEKVKSPENLEALAEYLEGSKYREIAEARNKPDGTVKSGLNFVRRKLRAAEETLEQNSHGGDPDMEERIIEDLRKMAAKQRAEIETKKTKKSGRIRHGLAPGGMETAIDLVNEKNPNEPTSGSEFQDKVETFINDHHRQLENGRPAPAEQTTNMPQEPDGGPHTDEAGIITGGRTIFDRIKRESIRHGEQAESDGDHASRIVASREGERTRS